MRIIRIDVRPGLPASNVEARVTLALSTDPALPDGAGLGVLFLPLAWVRVIRLVEPAFSILDADFALEWTGMPLEVVPDPRVAKIAKLVRRTMHLFC